MIKRMWWRFMAKAAPEDARWWQFWNPKSGLSGGVLASTPLHIAVATGVWSWWVTLYVALIVAWYICVCFFYRRQARLQRSLVIYDQPAGPLRGRSAKPAPEELDTKTHATSTNRLQ